MKPSNAAEALTSDVGALRSMLYILVKRAGGLSTITQQDLSEAAGAGLKADLEFSGAPGTGSVTLQAIPPKETPQ